LKKGNLKFEVAVKVVATAVVAQQSVNTIIFTNPRVNTVATNNWYNEYLSH